MGRGRQDSTVGIDPGAILHVHDIRGVHREFGEVLLDGSGLVPLGDSLIHELGHALHVVRVAT